jgi:hypothetical protein
LDCVEVWGVAVEDVGVDCCCEAEEEGWEGGTEGEEEAQGVFLVVLELYMEYVSGWTGDMWMFWGGLTAGTKAKTRKMEQRTRMVTEAPRRLFVPWDSKCCGHRGSHHGFEVCCLLKTASVWAEVPRMQREKMAARPMRPAWAMWRGAGLILKAMVTVVVVVSWSTVYWKVKEDLGYKDRL